MNKYLNTSHRGVNLVNGYFYFGVFLLIFFSFALKDIHDHIWNNRVHLAASISRLRIKNSALSLIKLLPLHLQDDKVALATVNPICTGWVNPFKLK